MALPNTNISTTLVGNTIGSASRDVGTLCTHPNINKWSKWKPVRLNKLNGVTETDLKSINWGYNPASFTPSDLPSSKSDETNLFIWGQWLKPRGGSYNEFYRLGDFRNYNHIAATCLKSINLMNHNNGIKPISGNPSYPSFTPLYRCVASLDMNADIKLSEFHNTYFQVKDLYLTLIIGGNYGGLTLPECLIAQSAKTIGQAIDDFDNEIVVTLNTSNLAETIGIQPNIVLAYFAPYIDLSNPQLLSGISAKIYPGIETAVYNSTYAVYGDGSSDGGNLPVTTVVGTWSWVSSDPTITFDTSLGSAYMNFDMLSYTITNGSDGRGNLKVYIQELNLDLVITQSDTIYFGTSSGLIDTSLEQLNLGGLINPDTGNLYTTLNCLFYVTSITPTIQASFNQSQINIPVIVI